MPIYACFLVGLTWRFICKCDCTCLRRGVDCLAVESQWAQWKDFKDWQGLLLFSVSFIHVFFLSFLNSIIFMSSVLSFFVSSSSIIFTFISSDFLSFAPSLDVFLRFVFPLSSASLYLYILISFHYSFVCFFTCSGLPLTFLSSL